MDLSFIQSFLIMGGRHIPAPKMHIMCANYRVESILLQIFKSNTLKYAYVFSHLSGSRRLIRSSDVYRLTRKMMASPAKIQESNPGAVIPFVPAKESFSGLTYYFSRYKLRRYNTSRQQLYALRRWSGWCMQPSNHVYLARDEHGVPCFFPVKPEGIAAFVRHFAALEPDTNAEEMANTGCSTKEHSSSSIKEHALTRNMIQ